MDGSHGLPKTQTDTALGFSITANLDGNRQIVVQSFVPLDMPGSEIDAIFDRVMGRIDRQRARYEIDEVQADLDKHVQTLAQFREDLDRLEQEHQTNQAKRQIEIDERVKQRPAERKKAEAECDVHILEVQQMRQKEWESGAQEHARAGRSGSYKPMGARARNLELADQRLDELKTLKGKALEQFEADYDASIATAHAEIERADAERDQSQTSLKISIKRYEDAIETLTGKLARIKAHLED